MQEMASEDSPSPALVPPATRDGRAGVWQRVFCQMAHYAAECFVSADSLNGVARLTLCGHASCG